jgi:predicted TIM-barrel fold metal-dependent hydrolase
VFDAHFHVIDARFPLVANQGFMPEPFTVEDYRARVDGLGVAGGAVVSGSFQAYDQTYLVDALERLGPGFVGVTQVPATIGDDEVLALSAAGVRAWRVNANRGASLDGVERLAARLHELAGWHLEISAPDLSVIPAVPRLAIDHLGLTDQLPELLRRVEAGAYVKASGFGRLGFDVGAALRAIAAVNPGALVFGTDLPGTRAPRPFTDVDVQLVHEHAGTGVFWRNAAALYRL